MYVVPTRSHTVACISPLADPFQLVSIIRVVDHVVPVRQLSRSVWGPATLIAHYDYVPVARGESSIDALVHGGVPA